MNLEWQAALDAVIEHPLFAFGLTLGVYQLALFLYEKTRWMIFQPVLVSMVILIATLLVLDIDYADYKQGAQLLTLMLGPATVALAVPLYLNMRRVRQVLWPTLITLFVGGLFATVLGVALAWMFGAETLILKNYCAKISHHAYCYVSRRRDWRCGFVGSCIRDDYWSPRCHARG